MDHQMLQHRFAALTTAHVADACIRARVPVRCASALLRAVVPGSRLAGRVCPARHAGSVDAFLEAFETAAPGDVLVVDNGGRLDEASAGDLVALEAQAAGMEGMVIWGLHRDTADIRAIGLPVFSLGAIPTGPLRLDARAHDALASAVVGDWAVSCEDLVLGDDDGVLFLPSPAAEEIFTLAETISDTEQYQAKQIRADVSLRSQLQFRAYLGKREKTPSLSFREHLRTVGGAIEGITSSGRPWTCSAQATAAAVHGNSLLWHQWVAALRAEAAVLARDPGAARHLAQAKAHADRNPIARPHPQSILSAN